MSNVEKNWFNERKVVYLMKKKILGLALLACMSIAGAVSAATPGTLHRDSVGQLHYVMSKEARGHMNAADITKDGRWIVPAELLAAPCDSVDVHKVLNVSEDAYNASLQYEGRELPYQKNTAGIIPCHEVMDMTESEYEDWLRQGNGGQES